MRSTSPSDAATTTTTTATEENDDYEELFQLLAKLWLIYSEQQRQNRPAPLTPVRRANFWKRANFWRKRANFWRRDLVR